MTGYAEPDTLKGQTVLVVEDDFFIAEDLRCSFEERGATVVGPAASVSDALSLIEKTDHIDAATLDVSLGKEKAFSVADAMRERGVPCVFVTGYDDWALPDRFAQVPRCTKPTTPNDIATALFGDGR